MGTGALRLRILSTYACETLLEAPYYEYVGDTWVQAPYSDQVGDTFFMRCILCSMPFRGQDVLGHHFLNIS